MRERRKLTFFLSLLAIMVVTTTVLALRSSGWGKSSLQSPSNQQQGQGEGRNAPTERKPAPESEPAPPEYVVYGVLFHHVDDVQRQADEAASRGEDASALRATFQIQANLNTEQAQLLNTIASNCVRETAVQDAKALAIIRVFRTQHPPGKIKAGTTPPPELAQMQFERNEIILRAKEQLRVALGDEVFSRFSRFVMTRIASGLHPVPLQARR